MNGEPLTVEQASAIFDILMEHAGAEPEDGEGFVMVMTSSFYPEYRFIGSLGFGGKFWRSDGHWFVTAYTESLHEVPERAEVVRRTTEALEALRSSRGWAA